VRILTVGNRYPPWSTGGYEAVWAATVRSLRAAGHQVRVLTTLPDPTDRPVAVAPQDVRRELSWYWRAHRFPRLRLRECVRLERANAGVLRDQLGSFAPDVVMWWAMGGMSLSLIEQVRRARLPALAVVGDEWLVYGPDVDGWSRRWRGAGALAAPMVERLAGLPARLRLDDAVAWSFNSEYTLAVSRRAGWRLAGAAVDHPGVELDRFDGIEPANWSWRLLYCGRIDPRKGIATTLRALTLLPGQARLRIHGTGDPAHADELRALADQLGVGDRTEFSSGSPDGVPDVYASCDALIFPVMWREPWGLVPLEAMAAGRPVLAALSGGGAAEYLEAERNCVMFEPGDAEGLAGSVGRLAEDTDLRSRLVAGGSATAARYPASAFDRALEARLESLAGGTAR
jgi:glycosyltransferase involved in cell wall biosynthesis